jgi:hypothetical protein
MAFLFCKKEKIFGKNTFKIIALTPEIKLAESYNLKLFYL